jgi:glycosyltransferase involved in cell wall biosynthesis
VTGSQGERIRVVRIISRLNVGGPAIHATLLTERLDPARYESLLVSGAEGADEGSYLDLHQRSLSTLRRVPELGREISGVRDLNGLRALTRIIRDVKPHIVHTHTAKAGALGRAAAWRAGVPIIVHTYHGHVFDGYFSPLKTQAFVAVERWLATRTHCLVSVSEQVRTDVLARGIGTPDKSVVVPLGLDLDRYLHAEQRRGELRREPDIRALGIDAHTPLIGIVARLVPIKAHEVFLDMAARVAAARPDARFLIIGDGERRQELETLTDTLGLKGRIHFLGWRQDLDRIYADLDAVVLTSRNEGSPVALTEAMAAARPVVSTRVGGVSDLISDGDTGLLTTVDDGRGLAESVLRVLGQPALAARLGQAGRARVRKAFDSRRLLDDIDRLYSRLLMARV